MSAAVWFVWLAITGFFVRFVAGTVSGPATSNDNASGEES